VRVGSFCIDETEVTQQQYYEFLTGGSTRELPGQAWCDWNTTVIPENWSDPPRAPLSPNNPVVDVDQCDAIAYCAWAGKRLCGHLQGGPISISERGPNPQLADARTDQWFYACSKGDDGMHAFAYANDYSPGTCNLAPGSLQPVKDFDACEGGFAGVHDLIGNVMEWEDSRDGPYATSNGTARGSSFDVMETPPEEAGCATTWTFARLIRRPDLGFRCCSGP
jgi:formylglycine-generating enzyme required for sulfatase activity